MFEILDGRKSFFQWDLNQKLIIYDASITEVHFCNKSADCALVCEVYNGEDGARVVNVPNILLQANRCIRAYGVAADHTEHYARFEVISRSKPADYVYTETEVKTFSTLEQRIEELEATVSAEGIAQAVEDYLEANPVEAGATAEERAQIVQNAKDISGLYEQAAGFALKSEIPSVDGFATTGYVDNAVNGIEIPEVDLSNYYTKAETKAEINNAKPNLAPYALKTEIPVVPSNVSAFANDAGYQTGAQVESIVDEAISGIDIPTGGGSGESYIAKLQTLASGTIPNGTAAGVTDTGLTIGDLRRYKYFVLYVSSKGQNVYWGLSWRSAWGCIGRYQHATIAFTYEWKDSNKTVLEMFIGYGTGYENGVGIHDNSSGYNPLLSKMPVLITMGADSTPIYVQNGTALTVDATWEIKGCLEYES